MGEIFDANSKWTDEKNIKNSSQTTCRNIESDRFRELSQEARMNGWP